MANTNMMVEFCLFGEDFCPEVITEALSIQPTRCHKKGDKIRRHIKKECCWAISTGYKEDLYLENFTKSLLDSLGPKKKQIVELQKNLG